jgi:DNA topoisomerase-1
MLEAEEERRKVSVQTIVEPVAEALGNTPAISRKSYVHPALIEAVKDNPREPLGGFERPRERKWLSSTEVGFLKFLEKQDGATHKRAA